MRINTFILGLVLSFFSISASAGSGHSHSHSETPISQQQAEANATKQVRILAEKGKLEESWKSVKAAKVDQKKFNGRMEWVVAFNNDNASDVSKRTLYVFLTLAGEYLAANHTGD